MRPLTVTPYWDPVGLTPAEYRAELEGLAAWWVGEIHGWFYERSDPTSRHHQWYYVPIDEVGWTLENSIVPDAPTQRGEA